MKLSPARRLPLAGRLLRAGVGLWVALLLVPSGASGQIELSQREARYREAVSNYNTLAQSYNQAFQRHVAALDQLTRARGTAGANEAFNTVLHRVFDLNVMDRELREALERLQREGHLLLQAIDAEDARLVEQYRTATLPPVAQALAGRIADLGVRRREVEEQLEQFRIPVLQPLPDVTIDPRDGPGTLRIKAGLFEERAEEYQGIAETLEGEIQQLERRIARERAFGDLEADLRRDADRQPGGGVVPRPIPTPPGMGGRGPSSDLQLSQLPLPEQLEVLREIRVRALDFRNQALAEAEVFRRVADGGSR